MRAAPAVTVHLPGSRRWDAACAGLGGVSCAAAVAAACQHLLPDAIIAGLCIAAAAFVGALLLWLARPKGRGQLRWDGACWWYRTAEGDAPEQAGSVMVMIDWGRWMLLRFDPQAGVRGQRRAWLPVSDLRVSGVAALRTAAYARAATERR
jgi:hypothetical protein